MISKYAIKEKELFQKIKQLSNKSKFKIIELTQNKELSITILSKNINLAYNKCSDYCTHLFKLGILSKRREGKNVFIKSNLLMSKNSIVFN